MTKFACKQTPTMAYDDFKDFPIDSFYIIMCPLILKVTWFIAVGLLVVDTYPQVPSFSCIYQSSHLIMYF